MCRLRRRVVLLTLAIVSMACTGPRGLKQEIKTPSEMSKAVLEAVPMGSELAEAERFMVGQGFDCRREVGQDFLDHKGIDYLYCNRYEGGLVKRRWQVAIIHRDGIVFGVLASTDLTGP